MKYKKTPILTSKSSPYFIKLSKEAVDGKSNILCEEICFIPDLLDIIDNITNSIDIENSLSMLDSLCSTDEPRPNPNRLLYDTSLFDSIFYIALNNDDMNILLHCLRILVHLSLANSLLDSPLLDPEIINQFIIFLSSEYNNQIHRTILHFLLNISLDNDFTLQIATQIFNDHFIDEVSNICISDCSPDDLILTYRIGINIAQLIYENELFDDFIIFNSMIQSLVSSLKQAAPQEYAIELLSYLFYNENCCKNSLNFNVIDMIKQSLETLPITSIPDAFTAINSLISNCNLIDEFIDNSVISIAIDTIPKIESDETHPFFVFFDSLAENRLNCLVDCGVIQFLFHLLDGSLTNKKKSIFVLSDIIDQNVAVRPRPEWMTDAIILVLENAYSLTSKNAEIIMKLLIKIHDDDSRYFFFLMDQANLEECLDEISRIDDISDTLLDYIQDLSDLVFRQEAIEE